MYGCYDKSHALLLVPKIVVSPSTPSSRLKPPQIFMDIMIVEYS